MREQKLQTDQADQRGNQKGPHNLQQEDIGRGQAIGGRRRCDAIDKGGAIGLQDLSSRTRGEVFLSVAAEIEITTGATGDCFRRGLPGAHRLCHQEHTQKSTPSHDPHRSWRGTQHGRHDSLSGKPPSNLDHSFGSSAQILKPERGWRQVRVVDNFFPAKICLPLVWTPCLHPRGRSNSRLYGLWETSAPERGAWRGQGLAKRLDPTCSGSRLVPVHG